MYWDTMLFNTLFFSISQIPLSRSLSVSYLHVSYIHTCMTKVSSLSLFLTHSHTLSFSISLSLSLSLCLWVREEWWEQANLCWFHTCNLNLDSVRTCLYISKMFLFKIWFRINDLTTMVIEKSFHCRWVYVGVGRKRKEKR